jgi:hypothetical protein
MMTNFTVGLLLVGAARAGRPRRERRSSFAVLDGIPSDGAADLLRVAVEDQVSAATSRVTVTRPRRE